MGPAVRHVLIASSLETSRRQIVASVTVGISGGNSDSALKEAPILRAGRARKGSEWATIPYSELASSISAALFGPSSPALAALLCDVSRAEFDQGHGMLAVLVVHKGPDKKPGRGFFELARELGLSGDDEKIWIDQFNVVLAAHKGA